MMKSDPYLARIESFNLKNGGGVNIKKVQNGYNTSQQQMHQSLDLTPAVLMMK